MGTQPNYKQIFYRVRELKRLCVNHLGGACSQCGLRDDIVDVYDFHHEGDKDANVSKLISVYGRRQATITHIPQSILDELAKCVLVCSTCHRRITFKEKAIRIEAGLSTNAKIKGRPMNRERPKTRDGITCQWRSGKELAKQLKCSRSNIYAFVEPRTET